LVSGLTLVVFWAGTNCDFVNLDDDLYVFENPHLRHGLSWAGLRYAWTTTAGGSWMPVTWISFLLDHALWGDAPGGYHATNILLHALNAGLLCGALFKMTRQLWPGAVAAALFAVHPLRVESVIWIAERKDVLSGLWFALTLLAYARYVARPGRARMVLTTVCLLCGLMAKPILVTLPLLLLLLDVWPFARLTAGAGPLSQRLRRLVVEKVPLFLPCAVVAAVTLATQVAAGAVLRGADAGLQRVLRVADNHLFYLEKLFWPHKLNVLYPVFPLSTGRAVWAAGCLALVSLAALGQRRCRPWLAVGWFWFLTLLSPVSGWVPIGPTWVADRYAYLPSVGIALMLAWTGWEVAAQSRPARRAVAGAAVLLVGALACLTVGNLPRWRDSRSLFADAVNKGEHPGAHLNLGVALSRQGQLAAAVEHFSRALQLNPASADAWYNRANALVQLGQPDRAVADFARAIELAPHHAAAHNNRGNLYAAQGRLDLAIEDFNRAIALRPEYAEALLNRARAYLGLSRFREAVADYSAAIALRPHLAAAYHDRAVAHYRLQDYARAWADVRTCRELGLTPNAELVRALEAASGQRQ